MASSEYSFIDIAVLDEVRTRFAAGDALAILSTDLDAVIWANGPGAQLFGYPDIEAIMGAAAGLSVAQRRQIAATPGFPDIGRDRPLMLRLARGASSHAVGFYASSVELPDGERAILLAAPAPAAAARDPVEIARRAVSGFTEAGYFAALVGEGGRLIAAAPGFETLDIAVDTVARLVSEVARERDRLVKRRISAGGREIPAGIARLADDPPTHLLVVVADAAAPEAAEAGGEPDAESASDNTETPAATGPVQADAAVAPETARTGTDAIATTDAADDGAGDQAVRPKDAGNGNGRTHVDRWYFDNEQPPASKTVAADEAREPAPTLADFAGAQPVRFVWRTDAGGRISVIAEEFARSVRMRPDELVGRPFADIAVSLGLDPDGVIAGLLARRDTWSGKTVSWPVAGTAIRVPVDLAALPVYGRDRGFEGFRGFGIARLTDAEAGKEPAAPDDAGTAEHVEADERPTSGAQEAAAANEPRAETTDDGSVTEAPGKVVTLASRRGKGAERTLSSNEHDAFREIGSQLRAAATEGTAEADDAERQRPADNDDRRGDETGSREETAAAADAPEEAETSDETKDLPPRLDAPAADEAAPEALAEDESVPQDGKADAPTPPAAHDEPLADAAGAAEERVEARPAPVEPRLAPAMEAGRTHDGGPLFVAPMATNRPDEPTDTNESETGLAKDGDSIPSADDDRSAPTAIEDRNEHGEPAADERAADASAESEDRHSDDRDGEDLADSEADRVISLPSAFAAAGAEDGFRNLGVPVLARLPIAVLVHSGDVLHFGNDAFWELTGYRSLDELDEAGGLGALFVEPYEDEETHEPVGRGTVVRTRDGREFAVRAHLQSIPWARRKALLLAITPAEVDQPKPEPEAIAETAALSADARVAEMRSILDTATDGVVLIAEDGKIRSLNGSAEALFGCESAQMAGKPFTSLFAVESQRAARDYLQGLSDNGVASVLNDGREVIGRESQGRFIPLFMTIGRLPSGGFCAVLRDITQWKRAEEELTKARAMAERSSSQKTDFLARVSHEIRTPLNAIIGFSELILDEKFGPIGNERYRDYLRDINRSGNHVLDLVNDLLDISKIEAGEQEMAYEAVSLNDALGEIVAMMQPQANRERVIIRSSYASRLPDVVADMRSIRQIALNLLSNAVRFTPPGGQVIVSTSYEASGDVFLRVRDTGVGMSSAEIDQALKPFKQINSLKRKRTDGTGLGLPLTKAMVEANRARFSIHSTPGEGTLVEICFPSTRVLAD
ncbi:PAS domain S-box protein [Nitratireductor mangrovi]|uniref:histidine kinase n=2 Tax=Nitratireductor mangrovi TaxID=2599600 RepID=A0A5B8L685_9HYPH|nr:histidine kinase dimerization/phospho-acceptor domain-containing protein [Nitratireductor mangrovi]QDZ03369.1 PAS domain S-box protein [Nitratireductor mangrovi]